MRGSSTPGWIAAGVFLALVAMTGCKKGKDSETAADEKKGPPPASGTMSLQGMYTYMADAGSFLDCATREEWPVAMEADNATLERALRSGRGCAGLAVARHGRRAARVTRQGRPSGQRNQLDRGPVRTNLATGNLRKHEEGDAGRDALGAPRAQREADRRRQREGALPRPQREEGQRVRVWRLQPLLRIVHGDGADARARDPGRHPNGVARRGWIKSRSSSARSTPRHVTRFTVPSSCSLRMKRWSPASRRKAKPPSLSGPRGCHSLELRAPR